MRLVTRLFVLALGVGVLTSFGTAQQPKGKRGDGPPRGGAGKAFDKDAFFNRLMAFDKNKDGKLTKDEITDERLLRLFDRADADKDGVVTKEELTALAAKLAAEAADEGGRPGGFGPPDGPGGPGGRGPGGRGPGFGGPPQPGQVMPPFLQEQLKLSAEQRKLVEDLQKEVDGKLNKILSEEQKQQLKEMRERGPGRFGPPPGEGGRPGERPGRPKGPQAAGTRQTFRSAESSR